MAQERKFKINPHAYSQLIVNKIPRQFVGEGIVFPTMMMGQLDIHIQLNLYLPPYTKSNFKWITDLNSIKGKTIKL